MLQLQFFSHVNLAQQRVRQRNNIWLAFLQHMHFTLFTTESFSNGLGYKLLLLAFCQKATEAQAESTAFHRWNQTVAC